jgi:putative membrane protein
MFFSASSSLASSFFVGLIAGSMGALFKGSKQKNGKAKHRWPILIFSFIFMFAIFLFFQLSPAKNIQPNLWWFLFCGLLWGLSLIVPGMTTSSILIFMGLYEPLTAGISAVDIGVLGPMVIGILAVVLLLSRAVESLFRKCYSAAYHVVIGFVAASTLIIVPYQFSGIGEALLCLLLIAVGLQPRGFWSVSVILRINNIKGGVANICNTPINMRQSLLQIAGLPPVLRRRQYCLSPYPSEPALHIS